MSTDSAAPSNWDRLALLARAVAGDEPALTETAGDTELCALAAQLDIGASLSISAREVGLDLPAVAAWDERRREVATVWLMVEETAATVFPALASGCDRWAPIKGYSLGCEYYPVRERRPVADLDVLIPSADLEAVCEALDGAGWERRLEGDRVERYLAEEGYACQFYRRDSAGPSLLLEVHFRLWGMVAEGLDGELLERSREVTGQLAGYRSLLPEHAYLLAALHAWTRTRPRKLSDFMDLEAILGDENGAGSSEIENSIVEAARRWGLELPTCLSAAVAARLWPGSGHDRILAGLEPELGGFERRQLVTLRQGGIDGVALSGVVLARLLAGRASRAGWKSVWRRVWAHPGVVELETPAEWGWSRRRAAHVRRRIGLG